MYKHTEIRLMSYAAFFLLQAINIASLLGWLSGDLLNEIISARLVLFVLSVPAVVFMVFGEQATRGTSTDPSTPPPING